MTRFVVGYDRSQSTLFPERLDDYLGEDNPKAVIPAGFAVWWVASGYGFSRL